MFLAGLAINLSKCVPSKGLRTCCSSHFSVSWQVEEKLFAIYTHQINFKYEWETISKPSSYAWNNTKMRFADVCDGVWTMAMSLHTITFIWHLETTLFLWYSFIEFEQFQIHAN